MAKRIAITKSLRFEVFKRDKFTCHYCGRKAPDVVLHIDHIEPVSKGGGNEILNLVTSCFDCNMGKKDKKLDDNSVVEKQRKQLELLQERREQMELMIEWKKSLANFDEDKLAIVIEYIEGKINPYTLNATGKSDVANILNKHPVNQVLDTIDEAYSKCVTFDAEGADRDSVEKFIKQLPRFIAVKNMPPIKQKMAYLKGICRNRFNYWDDKEGTSILNAYVKALEDYGWSEERIINDLDTEVMEKTKNAKHWSEWRSILEKWTDDIRGWNKPKDESIVIQPVSNEETLRELSDNEIENCARRDISFVEDKVAVLIYLAKAFPYFSDEMIGGIKTDIYCIIYGFLDSLKNRFVNTGRYLGGDDDLCLDDYISSCSISQYFVLPEDFDETLEPLSWGALEYISNQRLIDHIIKDILQEHSYLRSRYDYKSILAILDYVKNHYSKLCVSRLGTDFN